MKKVYFRGLLWAVVAVLCLLVLPGKAEAAPIASGQCGENVYWTLEENYTLILSGEGPTYHYMIDTYILEKPWKQWQRDIVSVIVEPGVTELGMAIFCDHKSLTHIQLPPTLEAIGYDAFYVTPNLEQVRISDLKAWCGIQFGGKDTNPLAMNDEVLLFVNDQPVIDMVIPEGTERISSIAFANYAALKSVTVAGSVKEIGSSAFANCGNLALVKLEEGVEQLKMSAFASCRKLSTLHFPSTVTLVEEKVFDYCDKLENNYLTDVGAWVSIPNDKFLSEPIGHQLQGVRRFYLDGKLLTDVVIPEGVTAIRHTAFRGAEDITAIHYPSTITDLGNHSLDRCVNLQEIYLEDVGAYLNAAWHEYNTNPMEVSQLPKKVYLKGKPLTELVIPGSVSVIRHWAFYNCPDITSVKMENGVQEIGRHAFEGCVNLKSITYPDTITWVGEDSLLNCEQLTEVHFGDIKGWLNCEIENYYGNPVMANALEKNYYLKGKLITDLKVPEGTTQIPYFAFYNYTKLKTITLPESVSHIGRSAFEGCTGLEKIAIPGKVETVPEKVFQGCTSLTEAVVSEGVKELDDAVFWGCSALKKVTLPSTLEKAGFGCFYDCQALDEIYAADIASWLKIDFTSPVLDVNFLEKKLHIGGKLLTKAVIPEGIETIPAFAFHDCKSLTSVKLPKSITDIGESAFQGCDGLTEIQLPEGLTTIGKNAFSGVYHLSEVKLPSSLTTLGERAFYCIWDLTAIDIPGSVTVIGHSAFAHCGKLANITLHKGLQVIEPHAFNGCAAESITIPEGVTTLRWGAFVAAQKLKCVVLPASLTTIEKGVFEHSEDLWHVLYTGTEAQWKAMSVAENNDYLLSATRHYGAKGDEVSSVKGKLCSLCGTTCDHNWGRGTITREPTCTADGQRTFTCDRCGEKRTEAEPKTGHSGGLAATTESPQICVNCGIVLQEALPKPATTVPPVTAAPTTIPPTTAAPTTVPPTTAASTTEQPTTEPATTVMPTTTAPADPVETTTEPEETTAAPMPTTVPTTIPETTVSVPTEPQPGNGGVWIVVVVILLAAAAAAAVVIVKRHPELLDQLRRHE